MSIWIDRRFLLLISDKLERFKDKGNCTYNCRCFICGDSQKSKIKARGYFYIEGDSYFYKCWNCGKSLPFGMALKHIEPAYYSNYILEKFKNPIFKREKEEPKLVFSPAPKFSPMIMLDNITSLSEDHWVVEYVKGRCIPEKYFSDLYYAPDFKGFVNEVYPEYDNEKLYDNDPRLVIPFYDEKKNLIGFQGRTLKNNKVRYITIKMHYDALKLFGLDRLNKNETIYIFEGPIDSMFVENSVATCDSTLYKVAKYLPKEKLVLVFDAEYHNKDLQQIILKSIEQDFNVCLFPKTVQGKDINDFVKNGMKLNEVKELIDSRTFSGLRAQLEFNVVKG